MRVEYLHIAGENIEEGTFTGSRWSHNGSKLFGAELAADTFEDRFGI